MNKTLLLLLFSFLSLQVGFAQLSISETVVNETVEIGGPDKEIVLYLTNNSATTTTVKWDRTQDLPDGWQTYVCDIEQCFFPGTSTSEFNIESGQEVFFKMYFRATAEGTVSSVVDLYDVNNTSDAVQVTYNASSVTSDVDDLVTENIKVYPNPTSSNIYISNTDGIQSMEVYNIIGKKVRHFADVDSATPYNIEDLPRGMYLIRLLDKDSDVVTTKRISKR